LRINSPSLYQLSYQGKEAILYVACSIFARWILHLHKHGQRRLSIAIRATLACSAEEARS
ncbi:hypothetical protein, partial [Janthinobacterium sp. HH100]|uniref:hypothetical protein n=1 Tax=Janthinobacterium sp. HH100 TaxID=1537272 RepID=UPI001C2F5070